MKRKILVLFLLTATVIFTACSSAVSEITPELTVEAPDEEISAYLGNLFQMPDTAECTGEEAAFIEHLVSLSGAERKGECSVIGADAIQKVKAHWPELSGLAELIAERMQTSLNAKLENAVLSSEVYTDELEYRPDVLSETFAAALTDISGNFPESFNDSEAEIYFNYDGTGWSLFQSSVFEKSFADYSAVLANPKSWFDGVYEEAVSKLVYVRKLYPSLSTDASLTGYVPLESCYGESSDSNEIQALINSPKAVQLTGGQQTAWTPDIELLPGTGVKYYLDDTILVLVWQEVNLNCVCTFGEVFVSDASQFRRKLTDDMYHSETLLSVQELAEDTSAVLALSGDMSGRRNRDIGVFVYNGEIYRFHPETGDTCFVTGSGDMLFSKRYHLTGQEEAEILISENDVAFSLCFGPAVIENGEEITPQSYPWGEILGKYARDAIGQVGELHYLTFNGNYLVPGYTGYLTAGETARILLDRGCLSAYLLDGGFTACTVFNNQRINPVNGDNERPVSDIIYFASALPNN